MRNQTSTVLLRWVAPASLVAGLVFYACSGTDGSKLDKGAPEYAEYNQKPALVCSIKTVTGNTVGNSRIVSSDPRLSKLGENLIEGDSVLIDCSQCKDDSTAPQDLTFELSQDYDKDNPEFEALSQGNMQRLDMNEPGRPIMALRVTDHEGASTTVPFTMVTQCADGTIPSIDDASLSVSNAGDLNLYKFKVNATGLGSGLRVSLDFNGDAIYDPPDSNRLSTWTTDTTFTKYVEFVGERLVGLKVANACELEASTQIAVNFSKDNLPRVPGTKAVRTGFPYVQFNLGVDTLQRLGEEAKFLFTKGEVVWSEIYPDSTMKGFAVHNYYESDTADTRTAYAFSANIAGFHDNCNAAGTTIHDANVKELTVDVAGTTDGVAPMYYTAKNVPAEVTVVCLEASHGCNGGSSGLIAARQLLVEIPSAEMVADDGGTATFTVGLISADRGSLNYTCGGGGCGGGSGTPAQ
jgi:hypothetical protein